MSFVSIDNLVTPFRDKFHYVTLILVGAVFLAIRLSGAEIEARPVNEPATNRSAAPVTGLNAKGLPNLSIARIPDAPAATTGVNQLGNQFNPAAEVQRLLGNPSAPKTIPDQGTITLPADGATRGSIEDLMRQGTIRRKSPEEEARERERRQLEEAGSLSEIEKRLGLK
ncbi:MAG: hypothetical protein K1X79_09545 [Oligoflexia bacterium]|nr:hypothetical protein [Oligoflexia bacterium]